MIRIGTPFFCSFGIGTRNWLIPFTRSCKNTARLQKPVKIILGIDPGTLIMGHGVIAVNGNSMELLEMSALKLSGKKDNYERLQLIHRQVVLLVKKFKPDEFAIEAPFFGKNVQSMLKLGRAQGVAIAAAMSAGVPVTEYSPRKIKQSITGNGNADKEQVWKMLQHILSLTDRPKLFDATDALAVAICHHFQGKLMLPAPATAKKKSPRSNNWEEFVARNPQRILKK
ncbi:MAG: crossover junction endodeoxyribonuclease RuvC [Chitinophagaceae bacterium]|nr:crossover junction endodeoxyribonuclease RuvC [Chitinophagaceae bacterium]